MQRDCTVGGVTTGPLSPKSCTPVSPSPSPRRPGFRWVVTLTLDDTGFKCVGPSTRPGAPLGSPTSSPLDARPGSGPGTSRCQEADAGTRKGGAVVWSRPLPSECQAPPAVLAVFPELSSCRGTACVAWASHARGIQSGELRTALKHQRAVPRPLTAEDRAWDSPWEPAVLVLKNDTFPLCVVVRVRGVDTQKLLEQCLWHSQCSQAGSEDLNG